MSTVEQGHDSELWRDEHAQVVSWRIEALERAGYGPQASVVLGRSTDVDLHEACDMLARGCSEDVALNILL